MKPLALAALALSAAAPGGRVEGAPALGLPAAASASLDPARDGQDKPFDSHGLRFVLAQDKRDRVQTTKGTTVEGAVQKETYRDVTVSVGSGNTTVRADEVIRIDFHDAPPSFKSAVSNVEQEKWAEAISGINSAEEYYATPPRGTPKPRAWFPPYALYYRGLCQLELGKLDDALKQFDKIRKEHKDCRFLPHAYELTLRVYREKGDAKGMDGFEKEIDSAPAEIKAELKLRAKRQRAELLYDKNQYAEARKLFEDIALASAPEIAAEGTIGVIKCLQALKDQDALKRYVDKVLTTASQPSLMLIASNALGDIAFEKKQFVQARASYIQSVVRHNPGRTGTGIEREHERALYQLGRCYEELMNAAKEDALKQGLMANASSTFRELSIEYPSGRYREEAAAKAVKYEPKDDKKDEKKK